MHAAAKYIANKEKFPTTYEEIRQLKGIGEYTAAAICSFAYNQPYAVLDGNVYRVLSRYFGISTPIDTTAGKKEFSYLANELLDRKNSAVYNSAIMDFGALQCRPKAPNCQQCPLQETCSAYTHNKVEELPIKSKKVKIRERFFTYVVFTHSNTIFLQKRAAGDIWQGLYEPLLIENNSSKNVKEIINTLSGTLQHQAYTLSPIAESVLHILTHQRLNINFYEIKLETLPEFIRKEFTAVEIENIHEYGMPQVVKKILINYFLNK
jgi:A/G-specific adenine glycosylase